jgi:hypothetical protein
LQRLGAARSRTLRPAAGELRLAAGELRLAAGNLRLAESQLGAQPDRASRSRTAVRAAGSACRAAGPRVGQPDRRSRGRIRGPDGVHVVASAPRPDRRRRCRSSFDASIGGSETIFENSFA